MRTKNVREGDTVPLAPKRKRQARRRERHEEKQELNEFKGVTVTKHGKIVLFFGK